MSFKLDNPTPPTALETCRCTYDSASGRCHGWGSVSLSVLGGHRWFCYPHLRCVETADIIEGAAIVERSRVNSPGDWSNKARLDSVSLSAEIRAREPIVRHGEQRQAYVPKPMPLAGMLALPQREPGEEG